MIDAAEAIVRERGIGALRLDQVADAVGLHRSSVYRYVDSKEELIIAVVVQATMRIGLRVLAELGPDPTPEQLLVDGLALALVEMAEDPVPTSLMAPSTSEAMARVGSRALLEGIRPLVEPMFAAAADQGMLRAGVRIDDAIRWLQIVAAGLVGAPGVVPDSDELRDLLRLMLVPALLDA